MWEYLLMISNAGKLKYGDITQASIRFGVSCRTVRRIWKRGLASMTSVGPADVGSALHRCGRKKVNRVDVCERIRAMSMHERTNQRKLKHAAETSLHLIQQLLKEGYLRRALKQTRPLLTPEHKIERLKFCVDHVTKCDDGSLMFDPMLDVVHLDEKWFYSRRVGQSVYVLTDKDGKPAEEAPQQYVKSKRFINKVMFLCAVARPRDGWDGKVGPWPVVETVITQRASKNRPAGVTEMRPVTMDRDVARSMLLKYVIPAIKEKWPVHQRNMSIRIQQDNASPHVLESDPVIQAECVKGGWKIGISQQPAQSPDLNVNDLGFFTSIQSLQDFTLPQSAEHLVSDVKLAFEKTTAATLNKTFLTLQTVMIEIMKCQGGFDYALRHIKKDHLIRLGELPFTLPCDMGAYSASCATLSASYLLSIGNDLGEIV